MHLRTRKSVACAIQLKHTRPQLARREAAIRKKQSWKACAHTVQQLVLPRVLGAAKTSPKPPKRQSTWWQMRGMVTLQMAVNRRLEPRRSAIATVQTQAHRSLAHAHPVSMLLVSTQVQRGTVRQLAPQCAVPSACWGRMMSRVQSVRRRPSAARRALPPGQQACSHDALRGTAAVCVRREAMGLTKKNPCIALNACARSRIP